jgi:hypothetical protein
VCVRVRVCVDADTLLHHRHQHLLTTVSFSRTTLQTQQNDL